MTLHRQDLDRPLTEDEKALVTEHLRYVKNLARSLAYRYRAKTDIQDLVSYGVIGLCRAAQTFDSSRGAKFSTYAYQCISYAMIDAMRKLEVGRRYKTRLEFLTLDPLSPSDDNDKPSEPNLIIPSTLEHDLVRKEAMTLLRHALAALDSETRSLVLNPFLPVSRSHKGYIALYRKRDKAIKTLRRAVLTPNVAYSSLMEAL